MILYFDWNILVDLFEDKLKDLSIEILKRDKSIIIPYSNLHLSEGLEYKNKLRQSGIIKFISNLTNNQCLYIDPYITTILEINPESVNIHEKFKNEIFSQQSNFNFKDLYDLSDKMGFKSIELNNLNSKYVIKEIDSILTQQEVSGKLMTYLGGKISFNNLIEFILNFMVPLIQKIPYSQNLFTEKYLEELRIQFSLYLLNCFGYWKEKSENKDKSFEKDTYHSVYASQCDYFITNDKKLYYKTKAIYENFNLKSEVILLSQNYAKILKLF